jgi:phosphatidylinositol alpha-1,6-mannosyltransferase
LIFVNHPFIAPVALAAKVVNPFVRYVVHCHGTEVWHAMKASRQVAVAGASLVTATSDYTRRQLLATQRLRPRRTLTLHPPLPDVPAAADTGTMDRPPYFLLVSRLDSREPTKGVDVAIRAYRELMTTQRRNCRLLIVGEGDDRPRLEEIAGSAHLASGNIQFRTGVADNELDRLYRGALAFVLPSTQEGLGIVFLEAMARSIPAIGANAGGIPEVIDHEVNGFLVEGGNIAQLAEAMARLLTEAGLAEKYGLAAKKKTEAHFSVGAFDKKVSGIISDLL